MGGGRMKAEEVTHIHHPFSYYFSILYSQRKLRSGFEIYDELYHTVSKKQ
jgi:hypothetical protein